MESRPGCLGLPRRGSISQDPVAAWSRLGYDRNNLEPRPAGRNVFRGEGTQNFTGQASGGETPRPRDSGSPSGSPSGPGDSGGSSAPPAGPPDGSPSGPPSNPLADDSGQPERVFPKEPREEPEGGGIAGKIHDILSGAEETTNHAGVARNFEKTGGFEKTLEDFNALQPENVKDIQTRFGLGIVGYLEDGITIVARPGSKTGGATLEIRVSSRKIYKIRY